MTDTLLSGYRRFRTDIWPARQPLCERLAEHGQTPHALVIACADSRADPAMVFDAAPGELFVVRNIAALVPPYTAGGGSGATEAAIEYAVRALNVRDIVVMGHGLCGGVHALLTGVPDHLAEFLGPWLRQALPACEALAPDAPDRRRACEHATVRWSLANLAAYPWVAERVRDGRLRLHGAHFDIGSGELALLGADGCFIAA